ncbi:MAG: hypothetical protein RL684_3131 [Pseudomonadota bacterium]|jgi:Mlc titration factor MtfA (ptsG expression regulator)
MSHSDWAVLAACAVLLTPLWFWLVRTLLDAHWLQHTRLGRRLPHGAAQPAAAFGAAARMQLARDCALYRRLPRPVRQRVESIARELLARHRFRGCAGLVVTASMTRLVAVQAALLVLARGAGAYDALGAVLLYPDEFLAQQEDVDEAGVVSERSEPVAGQSLDTSGILLAWPEVLAGAREGGGYNVVVHEFAHFLDHASAGALSSPDDAARRGQLLQGLESLRDQAGRGEPTLIDPYATLDEAEFFAVASEHFIGEPRALRAAHPQLHDLLVRSYGFDPASWGAG